MTQLRCIQHYLARAAVATAALMLSVAALPAAESPGDQVTRLRDAGRLDKAADVACEWVSREPGNVTALRACAELGAKVGRYSRAENALRSLLFYCPNDPETLTALGEVLLASGRFQEARGQFEAAIHVAEDPARAYVGLARATVYDSESPGDVLSAAEVALAVAPASAAAQTTMGTALRELGRLDEAIEALKRARQTDPGYAPATFGLGLAWLMQGEDTLMRRAWERFVEMAPFAPATWMLRHGLVLTDVEEVLDRAFDAQYSPDGERIAYRSRGEGGWGIYTIPAQGPPRETRLWATDANLQALAWSPDSSQIALSVLERETGDDGKQQWTRRLYVVPADGGEATMVLEDRYLGEIAWNPATGRIGVRNYVRRQGWSILEIDPESGESERVEGTDGGDVYYAPTWSRDGAMMLAARRSDRLPDGSFQYDLVVGPSDDFGSGHVIHRCESLPRGMTFTPDGAVILYDLPGAVSGRYNTWAVPSDGSREPVLIDHLAGSYVNPSLTPDGAYLLTCRATMLVRVTLAGLPE